MARPAALRQVHGSRVVSARDLGEGPPEADGVAGRRSDPDDARVPAVRTADCVPVLLASLPGLDAKSCASIQARVENGSVEPSRRRIR